MSAESTLLTITFHYIKPISQFLILQRIHLLVFYEILKWIEHFCGPVMLRFVHRTSSDQPWLCNCINISGWSCLIAVVVERNYFGQYWRVYSFSTGSIILYTTLLFLCKIWGCRRPKTRSRTGLPTWAPQADSTGWTAKHMHFQVLYLRARTSSFLAPQSSPNMSRSKWAYTSNSVGWICIVIKGDRSLEILCQRILIVHFAITKSNLELLEDERNAKMSAMGSYFWQ